MKSIMSILIVLFACSFANGQCPGGTCTRPVKSVLVKTKSVVTETKTKTVATVKVINKKRFHLFKRHR